MPNRKGRRNAQSINIPTGKTSYSGPTTLPNSRKQNRTSVQRLVAIATYSSSAGGVIDQSINNDPSGYQDWSNLAALWDDYRVLSMKITYIPSNRYTKPVASTTVPWYRVIDRDSTGVLGTAAAAVQYESCVPTSMEDPWVEEVRMEDVGDAQFITTSSTAATFCVKGYNNGFTASTQYGQALVELLVQFRGRN